LRWRRWGSFVACPVVVSSWSPALICALARRVRVSSWNVGGVPLPTVVVSSSPIAGLNAHPFGLVGSDVLSRFGSVTIDYANKQLILG